MRIASSCDIDQADVPSHNRPRHVGRHAQVNSVAFSLHRPLRHGFDLQARFVTATEHDDSDEIEEARFTYRCTSSTRACHRCTGTSTRAEGSSPLHRYPGHTDWTSRNLGHAPVLIGIPCTGTHLPTSKAISYSIRSDIDSSRAA